MEYINATIINKFGGLVSYLTKTTEDFEMVADEVEDCNLKTAFNSLSAESLQYANELTNQLRTLGLNYPVSSPDPESFFTPADDDLIHDKGDEVHSLCTKTENYITQAYNEILGERFPFPRLKKIMTYQLNALLFSFMKIRLLNLTRFS